MMIGKAFLWHLARLALAAILLAIDVRFFLFYAFTVLLTTLHHIDHLRALVRVLSLGHDAKLVAIYEHLGITADDVVRINERMEEELTDPQRRSLDNDWRFVTR